MKKQKKLLILPLSLFIIVTVCVIFLLLISNKDKKHIKDDEFEIENLIGKNLSYAEKYALENSLVLEIEYEYNDDINQNIIISQENNNKTVKVLVSLGKIDRDLLREKNVDELGKVPVMMYHGIHDLNDADTGYTGGNVDKDGYQRTKESFIRDLEFYYQKGYRMIRLIDYVNGIIDVPLGYSPIVLTFDDGNNIRVLGKDENGNLIIDENSAVGILESFKKKYPDYNVTATFFVNGGLFDQPEYNEEILKWLVEHGYDVGNHTYSHLNMEKLSTDETQKEIGRLYNLLNKIIPNKYVNIVALPFGTPYSLEHPNRQYILNGEYDGIKYTTISTLRVGYESELSPFSKNFNPTFIKRIRAYDNNGVDFDIEYNFKKLETTRFISDGNKDKITVKETDLEYVNEKYLDRVISY